MKVRFSATSLFIALIFCSVLQATTIAPVTRHSKVTADQAERHIQSLKQRFQMLKVNLSRAVHNESGNKLQIAAGQNDRQNKMLIRLFALQQEMKRTAGQIPSHASDLKLMQKQMMRMIHDARNQEIRNRIISSRTAPDPSKTQTSMVD